MEMNIQHILSDPPPLSPCHLIPTSSSSPTQLLLPTLTSPTLQGPVTSTPAHDVAPTLPPGPTGPHLQPPLPRGQSAFLTLGFFKSCLVPQVETASGPVRGGWLPTTAGGRLASFQGLPFAAPPVGARRFAPPHPVHPWTEELDLSGVSEVSGPQLEHSYHSLHPSNPFFNTMSTTSSPSSPSSPSTR